MGSKAIAEREKRIADYRAAFKAENGRPCYVHYANGRYYIRTRGEPPRPYRASQIEKMTAVLLARLDARSANA